MYVKNRMTKNPICIGVNNKISEVVDIMNEKKLHRIPVVNGKKLVGLVTEGMISKNGATKATSLSIYELNYLLSKTTVDAIMIRDVITIHEDSFLEDAALLMYKHDIGCLPVVNDDKEVVGILTSNDVLSAFLDILGYRERGSRVCIEVKDELGTIGSLSEIFVRNNCNITHLGVYSQHNGFADMIIRIDTFQTDELEKDLEASGYKVLSITKNPN
ncbi:MULTISPECIES: CBS and ACT domain-containing protein [Bacillota]|jgi:acetoin utilization protein AcuB|uniref:CBS domain-containing protein n=2 Tax=Amedibacillus TaxID=2749846 RepID=A0A7G9GP37_9FIRM|nr:MULTISPECIES: CBS and ACT domain-containing protein [Bacillota]QNM12569.1 CBS domain-containing protein [[Eubacterium] hominis]MCH4284122.1 CBS and ACT domain-containing protein [Amedibacillus hominis]RGB57623.1 CBS domain-containing protein [Absiella sp. AM22-9]RGB62271.1 CBS domain-containing protein [Absiella sp. AM10-20]RGB67672.1 CBS domain-containing protein [Absiella sp. AM09-45]